MARALKVLASSLITGRHVSQVALPEGYEAFLVERLRPDEPAPEHPALPRLKGTVELDGRSFWVVLPSKGPGFVDSLRSRGAMVGTALEQTRSLCEGLHTLARAGIFLEDFYLHVVAVKEGLILDYPAALLRSGDEPSFPLIAWLKPESRAVCTLAAVLHGCLTGKPASDPPFVFMPPSEAAAPFLEEAEPLLSRGLNGEIGLDEFAAQVAGLDSQHRLQKLFPVAYGAGGRKDADRPDGAKPTRVRQTMDWILWAVCMLLGIAVLFKWG